MGLINGNMHRTSASSWIRLAVFGFILSIAFQAVSCDTEPTESQCRPYIEKALKHQHEVEENIEEEKAINLELSTEQEDNVPTDETDSNADSREDEEEGEILKSEEEGEKRVEDTEEGEESEPEEDGEKNEVAAEENDEEVKEESEVEEQEAGFDRFGEREADEKEKESTDDGEQEEGERDRQEVPEEEDEKEEEEQNLEQVKEEPVEEEEPEDEDEERAKRDVQEEEDIEAKVGEDEEGESEDLQLAEEEAQEDEAGTEEKENQQESQEKEEESSYVEVNVEIEDRGSVETEAEEKTQEEPESVEEGKTQESEEEEEVETEAGTEEKEEKAEEEEGKEEEGVMADEEKEGEEKGEQEEEEPSEEKETEEGKSSQPADTEDAEQSAEEGEQEMTPEEDLIKEVVIPENLRARDHITQILKLDEDSETESVLLNTIDSTLKSLKGLYDSAIKPLEMLYKYRDLSNRHFGDPEIFSKPLILFMGPWSGGKSSTINYLLDNEFTELSLRTGAEPSPAYFNILMYGKEEEVLDGTQLAADWTFSGLQKFGQSLLDRLKGYKLPNKLLEKVNIVEIPGILEIRKQVQRLFPFNDACQWFIDRADIIFLVYDPSKLDVGPETEAILDQLKGREYQTRIILNKADQVKPEELMRVQGTLIWNISPLMSSTEPPVMYSTSLWSMPYETGAPTRLLLAQERAFLRDLREAIDKRVDNKIASARRFAVRVRNHAKMVDCYLTTYYNHKTFFGNKKKISDDIIENPQKYHIYEGLSTLTNISRYDLPDPDVYKDFFKVNPLYDFTKLSDTCTYFRGCPINKLDVAIAYDLPELVGKYKKAVEAFKAQKTNS